MSKFKVGDKVIYKGKKAVVNYTYNGYDWGIEIEFEDGEVCLVGNTEVRQGEVKLYKKSLDNLEVGDVLVRNGQERAVLAVVDKLVALSYWDMPDEHYEWYTVAELRKSGMKLKDSEEITELTLEEVAELKGIPVEKLRIKDK